jgi:hypothetical protein
MVMDSAHYCLTGITSTGIVDFFNMQRLTLPTSRSGLGMIRPAGEAIKADENRENPEML